MAIDATQKKRCCFSPFQMKSYSTGQHELHLPLETHDLNLDGQGDLFITAKLLTTAVARTRQALRSPTGHRCNARKLVSAGKPLSF